MAPVYVMSLEDRVDIARNQLDVVILMLRQAVEESSGPSQIRQLMHSATARLEHVTELIGR